MNRICASLIYRAYVFVMIAEKNSVKRGAEAIGIRPPTACQIVKDFEEELGVTLYRREGRRVVLTPAGRQFYASTRDFVYGLSRWASQVRKIDSYYHADGSENTALGVQLPTPVTQDIVSTPGHGNQG